MAGILGYNEQIAEAGRWLTRTVTVTCPSGTTTSTLPATNIFTRNITQIFQRTGITSTDVVALDVRLVNSGVNFYPLNAVAGLVGLLGVEVIAEVSGVPIQCTVRFRRSPSAFTSGYDLDFSRTVYTGNNVVGTNQRAYSPQAWTGLNTTGNFSPTGVHYIGGGIDISGYWRIEITPTSPGGAWTCRVGRLAMLSIFGATIDPTSSRSMADDSEIVRAYSGTPYVLRKTPNRKASFRMLGMTDEMVYGSGRATATYPASSTMYTSNMDLIATANGMGGEVCVIPDDTMPQTASSGAYPLQWQTYPIFGMLESELVASRESSAGNLAGLWSADVNVRESPQR